MKKFYHQSKRYRFFYLASAALILVLLGIIPVRKRDRTHQLILEPYT
jgi:hypothetical protein